MSSVRAAPSTFVSRSDSLIPSSRATAAAVGPVADPRRRDLDLEAALVARGEARVRPRPCCSSPCPARGARARGCSGARRAAPRAAPPRRPGVSDGLDAEHEQRSRPARTRSARPGCPSRRFSASAKSTIQRMRGSSGSPPSASAAAGSSAPGPTGSVVGDRLAGLEQHALAARGSRARSSGRAARRALRRAGVVVGPQRARRPGTPAASPGRASRFGRASACARPTPRAARRSARRARPRAPPRLRVARRRPGQLPVAAAPRDLGRGQARVVRCRGGSRPGRRARAAARAAGDVARLDLHRQQRDRQPSAGSAPTSVLISSSVFTVAAALVGVERRPHRPLAQDRGHVRAVERPRRLRPGATRRA